MYVEEFFRMAKLEGTSVFSRAGKITLIHQKYKKERDSETRKDRRKDLTEGIIRDGGLDTTR